MICFWCFHQNDCNSQNWKARLRKRIHDETQDNYNKFEIIIVINILVHAHDWLNWYWKQSNVLFSPTINIYIKKNSECCCNDCCTAVRLVLFLYDQIIYSLMLFKDVIFMVLLCLLFVVQHALFYIFPYIRHNFWRLITRVKFKTSKDFNRNIAV